MLKSKPYRIESDGKPTFLITAERFRENNYRGHSYMLERFLNKCQRRGLTVTRTGFGAQALLTIPIDKPWDAKTASELWQKGEYTFEY